MNINNSLTMNKRQCLVYYVTCANCMVNYEIEVLEKEYTIAEKTILQRGCINCGYHRIIIKNVFEE